MNASKIVIWVVVAAIVVFVAIKAFDLFRENIAPEIADPTGEAAETSPLRDDSPVFITFDDNYYHRTGCKFISGPKEGVVFSVARQQDIAPCPRCIPAE